MRRPVARLGKLLLECIGHSMLKQLVLLDQQRMEISQYLPRAAACLMFTVQANPFHTDRRFGVEETGDRITLSYITYINSEHKTVQFGQLNFIFCPEN